MASLLIARACKPSSYLSWKNENKNRKHFYYAHFCLSAPSLCLIAASPPPKPKTRQVETLSQQTYDEITRAQTLAAKGQHKQALAALDALLKNDRHQRS